MDYTKFIVSFAGYRSTSTGYRRRRLKTPVRIYITKVSFGDAHLLSKWWYNDKRDAAQQFSKIMAEDIAAFLKTQRNIDVQVESVKAKEEVTL